MNAHHLHLLILEARLAVCGLDRQGGMPAWASDGELLSITRTLDEISVVCPESAVPEGIRSERGWRALRVAGILPFSLTGVLASLAVPLASAEVSLFALSTFETDYILIKEHDLSRAIEVLASNGHSVHATG